ncbi:hypothetical protein RUM8411_03104 [Ruegeria meonggei]|uniref:Uncharacterized protein n=1 Tax=Ruegeria meonggei TaxID=1446476 RepID=A0A1X6ZVI8_9RHOB|nr:hypothetical protein RUM8411_03104 [Ruegeria meonggei]
MSAQLTHELSDGCRAVNIGWIKDCVFYLHAIESVSLNVLRKIPH